MCKYTVEILFNDLRTHKFMSTNLLLLHSTTLCCFLMFQRMYIYAQMPARDVENMR
jgi:hypothetical protein